MAHTPAAKRGRALQEVDGRYRLLEDGWRNYRARRRARALTILPIVVAAALALLWLT